jgi:hypothetical protein
LQQQVNGLGEDGFAAFGFAGVVPVGLLLLARPVGFRLKDLSRHNGGSPQIPSKQAKVDDMLEYAVARAP